MEVLNRLLFSARKSLPLGILFAMLLLNALFNGQCFAQVPNFLREDFAEQAAAQAQLEDEDWQEFEAGLFEKKAINLNKVEQQEMLSWGILTPWQVQQFINYRHLLGNFIHVNELQAVPGWYPALIKMLVPYCVVRPENSLWEVKKKMNVKTSLRSTGLPVFLVATDSTANNWVGDNCRVVLQTRLEFAGWKGGFTAKKDPGEPFWKKGFRKGFDFYGFHLSWQGKGLFNLLVVGDYTVNLGQGLIHWQAMALRKTGELLFVKRQSPVIKPHRGGGEFNFHRGLAIQLRHKNFLVTPFISRRKLSASLSYDSLGVPLGVLSINSSGYHRTLHELASKNNLTEWIAGIRVAKKYRKFEWGVNGISYCYNLPLEQGASPYQLFRITGRSWQNASLDFSFTHQNAHFFGEAAIDKLGHKALLAGVILSGDKNVDLAFVVRSLSKEFQSRYANAFTENTSPTNEFGVFCSVAIRPTSTLQFNLYNDFYQFPWLRYQISMPSMGRDHYLQVNYNPSKSLMVILRFRQEQKQEDPLSKLNETPFPPLDKMVKSSVRVHLEKQMSRQLQIRFRMEALIVKSLPLSFDEGRSLVPENGFLCYWETRHSFPRRTANLSLRVQFYDTDSYKSRIYAFLPNPGAPPLISASYGKGFLAGVFLSKKLKNKWLINISLLVKNTSSSEGIRLFPGVRVALDL